MGYPPAPQRKEKHMTDSGRNTITHAEQTADTPKNKIRNTTPKDSGAKLIFDNHTLCAQFLRGYTDVELLKNVQPDDIEDISERFVWMWHEERESDSVKKVHLHGSEGDITLYLIALIEHQSKVDHDMSFRILRYPPILPIVFYDGPGNWTAATNFRERVQLSDILGEFIPDFHYLVVPLSRYSNRELVEKNDELSLVMLIDKLRSAADFRQLKDIPEEYFESISQNSPESVLKLIGKIIAVLLLRLNVPKDEVAQFTDQIERRNFTMLFENFEAYDVQETRRISRAEGKAEGQAEYILDLLEDLGTVPEDLKNRIMQERNTDTLRKWHKVAARAATLEEFEEKIKQNPS